MMFFQVKNVSSQTVPAFGVMRVTSIDQTDLDDGPVASVNLPDTDNATDVIINGFAPIPVGATGLATRSYPCPIAYAEIVGEASPSGRVFGVQKNSWQLSRYRTGFVALGGVAGGVGTFSPATASQTNYVRVLSDTATETGHYPAMLMQYNPDTGTMIDLYQILYYDPNR